MTGNGPRGPLRVLLGTPTTHPLEYYVVWERPLSRRNVCIYEVEDEIVIFARLIRGQQMRQRL